MPLFVLVFVGIIGYEYLYRRPKFIVAMERLAKALALEPVHSKATLSALAQRGYTWYAGRYKNHDVAMISIPLKRRVDGPWAFYLRLAVSVNVPAPLDIALYRDRERRGVPRSFNRAFPKTLGMFGQKNGDQLSPEARQALLTFVQQESPPTGLRLFGVWLIKRRRGRHVRLYDRQAVSGLILPPEILSDAPVVFMHDRPLSLAELYMRKELSPDEVRMLLDDMIDVAHSIEGDNFLITLQTS
jgi:hypothetical protein